MRESLKTKQVRANTVFETLKKKYPNVSTFLSHKTTFELLIAVILSAQCTDERVNKVTPNLFHQFPTPKDLMIGPLAKVKNAIKSINFFNNKSINIMKTAEIIHSRYKDEVPKELNKLIELPGVGRKTANVVLGQAFGIPGITVDTHVKRVSNRLGFTSNEDAVKAEKELMKVWKKENWIDLSTTLILHGRITCKAQKPLCKDCEFNKICPYNLKINQYKKNP